MVKLRSAQYCNLKLFLIYLVVYGHWIEPYIWTVPCLLTQYRWIYAVHMPLFAFLSGLFTQKERDCANQIKRLLPLYLLLQMVAVLLGAAKPLTPWWTLWYLLSCCAWMGAAWLWFRFCRGKGGWLILLGAVLFGCVAGYIPEIGREMSASRTIVFFPYFWAGLLCRAGYPYKKLLPAGLLCLFLAAVLMNAFGERIPTVFFYHAAAFGSVENGFWLRLVCYGIGGCLCLFLLTAAPDRRFPFTRAGADTMPVYLLHAPLVLLLRKTEMPGYAYPVLAAVLIYLIYKLGQWRGSAYGIVPGERRRSGGIVSKDIRRIRKTGIPLSAAADRG